MDRLFNDFTVNLLSKAMDGHVASHRILANNIANVNTPKFKASHVHFKEKLRKAYEAHQSGLDAEVGNRHIPLEDAQPLANFIPDVAIERNTTMRLDGNNVDIDSDMALMAENSHEYAVMSRLVADRLSGLRSAILGR